MESEKGKNNFLKKHGLCAVRLMERLSGWRGQRLGRLAAGRVIACFLSTTLRPFVRLCTEAEVFSAIAGLLQQAPAPASSLHKHSSLEAQGERKQRCKNSPWFRLPSQLVLGCPGLSPGEKFRGCPCPQQEDKRT